MIKKRLDLYYPELPSLTLPTLPNTTNPTLHYQKGVGEGRGGRVRRSGNMEIESGSAVVILNLFLDELLPKLPKLPRNEIVPYRETNTNHGSNGSSGSLSHFIDSMRVEENQENVKKNIIFTKLPKPIGAHCFICEETRPIWWIDQNNNNYCISCKKKIGEENTGDLTKND